MPVFKIQFVGRDGQPAENMLYGYPCIEIGVFKYPAVSGEVVSPVRIWALVDTGADQIYVDAEIVRRIGAPIIGQTKVNDIVSHVNIHELGFHLIGHEVPIKAKAVGRQLLHKEPYRAVLGRNFLQHCKLHFEGPGLDLCTIEFNGIAGH